MCRTACGDQIYADHPRGSFIPKLTTNSRKGYFKKYRTNYNHALQDVARTIPSFCQFDDHEVINDWSLGKFQDRKTVVRRVGKTKRKVKVYGQFHPKTLSDGLFGYDTYQGLLTGQIDSLEELKARSSANYVEAGFNYSYSFSHGNCGFFCLDVRYERIEGANFDKNDHPDFTQMISQSQMQQLIAFLNNNEFKVKFIISPVPLFPDTQGLLGAPWDKWKGGNKQRKQILEHIDNNNINNVFVLSGDVHCSFTAKLELPQGSVVHNIVSSALNWPIIGLKESNLALGTLYKSNNACSSLLPNCEGETVTTTNNFTTISYSENELTIKVFDRSDSPRQHHVIKIQ